MSTKPLSFRERLQNAEIIIAGTLSEQVSGRLPDQSLATHQAFTELVWLKGVQPESEDLILQVWGGQEEERFAWIPGAPQLEAGGRYILLIEDHLRSFIPFVGGSQGVFQVVSTPEGQEVVVDGEGRLLLWIEGHLVIRSLPEGIEPTLGNAGPYLKKAINEEQFYEVIRAYRASGPEQEVVQPLLEFGVFQPWLLED